MKYKAFILLIVSLLFSACEIDNNNDSSNNKGDIPPVLANQKRSNAEVLYCNHSTGYKYVCEMRFYSIDSEDGTVYANIPSYPRVEANGIDKPIFFGNNMGFTWNGFLSFKTSELPFFATPVVSFLTFSFEKHEHYSTPADFLMKHMYVDVASKQGFNNNYALEWTDLHAAPAFSCVLEACGINGNWIHIPENFINMNGRTQFRLRTEDNQYMNYYEIKLNSFQDPVPQLMVIFEFDVRDIMI